MEEEISVDELAREMAAVFGTKEYQITIDSFREILYIRIKGLSSFKEDKINELASPLLDEIESDYEEIILLDLD